MLAHALGPENRVAATKYLVRSEDVNVEGPMLHRKESYPHLKGFEDKGESYSLTHINRFGAYNYVPTVMDVLTITGHETHIWWCGSVYWGGPQTVGDGDAKREIDRNLSWVPLEMLKNDFGLETVERLVDGKFNVGHEVMDIDPAYKATPTDTIWHAVEKNETFKSGTFNTSGSHADPNPDHKDLVNSNGFPFKFSTRINQVMSPELWASDHYPEYNNFSDVLLSRPHGAIQNDAKINENQADNYLICDPSVIKLPVIGSSKYAMYYTGAPKVGSNDLGSSGTVGAVFSNTVVEVPTPWRRELKKPVISQLPNASQKPYGIGQQSAVVKDGRVYLFVVEVQRTDEPTDVWLYRSHDSGGVAFDPLFAVTKNGLDTTNFSQAEFVLDGTVFCSSNKDPMVYMLVGKIDGAPIDIYRICWSKLDASQGGFWKKVDSILTSSHRKGSPIPSLNLEDNLVYVRNLKKSESKTFPFANIGGDSMRQHMASKDPKAATDENYRNLCYTIGGGFRRDEYGHIPNSPAAPDWLEIYFGRGDGDPYCVSIADARCSPSEGRSVRDFLDGMLAGGNLPERTLSFKQDDGTVFANYYEPPYSGWNIERYQTIYKVRGKDAHQVINPIINLVRRTQFSPKYSNVATPQSTFLFSSFIVDASITVPDADDGKEGFVWIAMMIDPVMVDNKPVDRYCFLDESGEWKDKNCTTDLGKAPVFAFHSVLHDTQQFPVRSLYGIPQRKICNNNDRDYAAVDASNKAICISGQEKSVGYTVKQLEDKKHLFDKVLIVGYGFPQPGFSTSNNATPILELAKQSAWEQMGAKSANLIEPSAQIRLLSLTCWTACCTDEISQFRADGRL